MTSTYIKTQSLRADYQRSMKAYGVFPSEEYIEELRERIRSEAAPCPVCEMLVHPDMIERHNAVHHPVQIARVEIPTTPIITDTHKYQPGQVVRIAGTSHKLPIAEVKVLSKTWYRFDIAAGEVRHMWVEEARIVADEQTAPKTISPEPIKWSVDVIKYPLAFPVSMAIVLYQQAA